MITLKNYKVDLVKQTLPAPPSIITLQTDNRSNAEIMEATRVSLAARRNTK